MTPAMSDMPPWPRLEEANPIERIRWPQQAETRKNLGHLRAEQQQEGKLGVFLLRSNGSALSRSKGAFFVPYLISQISSDLMAIQRRECRLRNAMGSGSCSQMYTLTLLRLASRLDRFLLPES